MDQENVIYPYIGKLGNNKKEETIDTHKMDESQNFYKVKETR